MKKNKWLLIIIVVSIILTFGLSYAFRVTLNSYTDNNFKVEYDSTWKVVNDTNELKLKHKKTNSILHIQCKELDKMYMDISLNDLIALSGVIIGDRTTDKINSKVSKTDALISFIRSSVHFPSLSR